MVTPGGTSGGQERVFLQGIIKKIQKESAMKKLYIGNLSYNTTDESLRDAFSSAGNVATATVIKDKMTGRSRGFGFVEFENDADGDKAIEMWNGKELDGRKLVVNEAQPMGQRPPRRNFDRGGYGGGGDY